jgi:hypothetical protein
VLIEGSSGTGKELFAPAIHQLSRRRLKKFVAINCGALPDTLLESELFGYKAGAFTDARKDKPGRFALAEGGRSSLMKLATSRPPCKRCSCVLQERNDEPLGFSVSQVEDVRELGSNERVETLAAATGGFEAALEGAGVVLGLGVFLPARNDLPLHRHAIKRGSPRSSFGPGHDCGLAGFVIVPSGQRSSQPACQRALQPGGAGDFGGL